MRRSRSSAFSSARCCCLPSCLRSFERPLCTLCRAALPVPDRNSWAANTPRICSESCPSNRRSVRVAKAPIAARSPMLACTSSINARLGEPVMGSGTPSTKYETNRFSPPSIFPPLMASIAFPMCCWCVSHKFLIPESTSFGLCILEWIPEIHLQDSSSFVRNSRMSSTERKRTIPASFKSKVAGNAKA